MTLVHNYRYDLRILDADEQALDQFAEAFASSKFSDCMQQDPNDPELFSTEVKETTGSFWEETIEDQLHMLAMRFPSIKLHFTAEDLDMEGKGYELLLQGNTYRRSHYYIAKSDFSPSVPFEDRHKVLPGNPNPVQQPQSTKELAMSLYDTMLETHNKDNAAYYIAKNLAYLAAHIDREEDIPLDTLYGISERLWDVNWLQPLLSEERLDAVKTLLEEGYAFMLNRAGTYSEINITSDEMPEFLLTCNEDSFAYLVEETAFDNQLKYGKEVTSELMEWEKVVLQRISKESKAFKQRPEPLNNKITDAEQRTQPIHHEQKNEIER